MRVNSALHCLGRFNSNVVSSKECQSDTLKFQTVFIYLMYFILEGYCRIALQLGDCIFDRNGTQWELDYAIAEVNLEPNYS